MTRDQWFRLPFRLAILCVLAGAVVLAAMWYGSGEQQFTTTQMPYVVVGGGAGVGLAVLGASLYAAQRHRLDLYDVEAATARLLLAADRLTQVRRARAQAEESETRPRAGSGRGRLHARRG